MAIYSIKDLEKLTDIKAHTIRAWEQRYDIIKPKRTSTNIRYYSEEDLKRLLNIALLNKNGYKISKIAKMTELEIAQKVSQLSEINFEFGTQLDALTISMIEMDEYKFDRIISTNIDQIGFERTMLEIINPFLDKLSLLWLTGSINPAQEHFISCLIRQKIIVAIDKAPFIASQSADKFLIFLPEGSMDELSLLFLHYLLKSRGFRVIYLGANIPFTDLIAVHGLHQPEYIFTIFTESFTKEPVQNYVERLCKVFKETTVLLSGYQVLSSAVDYTDNVVVIESIDHAIQYLEKHKKK